MRSDWNIYDLGSVAEFRNGAGIKQDYFSDEGVPLVKVSNFTADSIDISELTKVETAHAEKWKSHLLKEKDIVIATVGSWPPNWSSVVGKVIKVPATASGFLQNQNKCCIQPNQEFIDNRFLYYLLRSDDFKHFAVNEAGGSANQARIPVGKLSKFKLLCPPLRQQKAIAHILGTLDDKIELNRQMNETLEAMAQALFNSWFVDFDPVIDKALAAGNEIPEPLQQRAQLRQQVPDEKKLIKTNPELVEAFPDRFTFTEELGWIPEGWEVNKLNEFAELNTSSVKPRDLPDELWEHYSIPKFDVDRMPIYELGDTIKSIKYQVVDSCVLLSKLNPDTPRIWLPENTNEFSICSTEFMQFVPFQKQNRNFLYTVFNSTNFFNEVMSTVSG